MLPKTLTPHSFSWPHSRLLYTQAFFDGLQGHGEEDIVMLPRAGWVGTWRHGAVLWSGDIGSTMPVLKSQVNIGISAQTSAIPWWTTDVGGYSGGHSQDPTYRETVGRWFQYGTWTTAIPLHFAFHSHVFVLADLLLLFCCYWCYNQLNTHTGFTCPLLRQHGARDHTVRNSAYTSPAH